MEMTAKKISLDPLIAASIGDMPASTFLNIFSVTTIPSSTTSPVARTTAKSVSTLMEKPKRYIIKKVAISETGMSIRGLKAIAQSLKNRYIIRITRIRDIPSVSATSITDFFTKVVVSIATFSLMSLGKSFLSKSSCL